MISNRNENKYKEEMVGMASFYRMNNNVKMRVFLPKQEYYRRLLADQLLLCESKRKEV